jgi:hypothetical protein
MELALQSVMRYYVDIIQQKLLRNELIYTLIRRDSVTRIEC